MPLANRLARVILSLHRWLRLIIVMLTALAYVLLFFPLVDQIYVDFFFDASTIILPSLVSVAIGGIVYAIGWFIIINPRMKPPPAPLPVLIYLGLALIVLFINVVLITMGINMLESVPLDVTFTPND